MHKKMPAADEPTVGDESGTGSLLRAVDCPSDAAGYEHHQPPGSTGTVRERPVGGTASSVLAGTATLRWVENRAAYATETLLMRY